MPKCGLAHVIRLTTLWTARGVCYLGPARTLWQVSRQTVTTQEVIKSLLLAWLIESSLIAQLVECGFLD